MKLKNTAISLGATAALIGGTVLVAMPAVAQDDTSEDTSSDSTVEAPPFRGGGVDKGEALAESLGLDTDELHERLAAGETIADIATAQGVPVDDVVDVMVAEVETRLAQAVEGERLTTEEADERLADIATHIEDLVNGEIPFGGPRGGIGHRGFGPGSEALTETLGVDAETLRAQLAEGETLADIAATQGVSLDELADALLAPAAEHLDEAVANGDLTQEEADERLAQVTERIGAMVNGEVPAGGPGFGRRGAGSGDEPSGGAGFGGGSGPAATDGIAAETATA